MLFEKVLGRLRAAWKSRVDNQHFTECYDFLYRWSPKIKIKFWKKKVYILVNDDNKKENLKSNPKRFCPEKGLFFGAP